MYFAGSHTEQKTGTAMSLKCLIGGDLRPSTRYQTSEKALKENPQVSHVVGHSSGGSVALQLETRLPRPALAPKTALELMETRNSLPVHNILDSGHSCQTSLSSADNMGSIGVLLGYFVNCPYSLRHHPRSVAAAKYFHRDPRC